MGYSARYHAASLAAVFFALAIGILIGSQVGGDILDNTRQDLESSLTGDLDDARNRIDDLETEQGWADDFGNSVFPALTENQLDGDRIGMVGFGSLPDEISDSVAEAIQPTGAQLVAVGVVRQPPDSAALSESLAGTRFLAVERNQEVLGRYAQTAGRQLVTGGRILALTRSDLLSQSSGRFSRLDGLIIYRGDTGDLTTEEVALSDFFDENLIEGARSTRAAVVGVERVETDPSSVSYFADNGTTSVDNLDQPAGKVSLVYALGGAEGRFGVKDDSDRLLPELLRPLSQPRQGADAERQG